jgi:hypothetical protein
VLSPVISGGPAFSGAETGFFQFGILRELVTSQDFIKFWGNFFVFVLLCN